MGKVLTSTALAKSLAIGMPKGRWWQVLAAALKAHAPLYALVLIYAVAGQLHGARVWEAMQKGVGLPELVLGSYILFVAFGYLLYRLAYYLVVIKPESPVRQFIHDLKHHARLPSRIITLLALYPVYFVFVRTFLAIKPTIGQSGFTWDAFFSELDHTLHFGALPWEWLYPLLSSASATMVINFTYHLWFFVMFATLMWVLTASRPDALRLQYMLAFFLTWSIGGSLLAHVFSSAGPAYYGRLGLGSDPYAPLMTHLKALSETVPVWALGVQEKLWEEFISGNARLGSISAFPSMHNAQVALMVLLGWRLGRAPGILMTCFAFMIALGSVWLGWHYAVDAYASFVLAVLCWWIAGHVARWMMRRPATRELDELQRSLVRR